jgi:hypothetical protein
LPPFSWMQRFVRGGLAWNVSRNICEPFCC